MRQILRLAAVLPVLLLAGRPAGALVIYDESVSGDLPGAGPAPPKFVLGPGDNEFSGLLDPGSDNVDRFQIEIPPGFGVFSIPYETEAPGLDLYTLTPVTGFDLPTVIGPGAPLSGDLLDEPPSSGPDLEELDPGIWEIELKIVDGDDPPWSLDFVVVPEPGMATLLSIVVAALVAVRPGVSRS